MTKLISSSLICICLLAGCNKSTKETAEVPAAVKESFANMFKNTSDVEWSKESETEFEVEFKTNEKEMSASFDATGKWLETETEIKTSDLPAAVTETIAREFPGYEIEEVEITETPEGSVYEAEIESGESKYEIQVSMDGTLLKKEAMEEEDEED